MADDPAFQQPKLLLPDHVLEEIFVRLPRKEFHQCRCLSRAWAAALSSDDLIDRHLCVRGKIRLGYDDLMSYLVLGCCIRRGPEFDSESEGGGEISEQAEISGEAAKEETPEEEEDEEEEESDNWREEYRSRGYVEVDKDYYIRRAETEAWAAEEWAKMDFSGVSFADSDDELLKACTIPLGALPPHIRLPSLMEDQHRLCSDSPPIRGREKTEEEVDQEIIAFLRKLLAMKPKPQFLKELDRYQWSPPAVEESDEEEEESIGQGDNLDDSTDREVGIEDSSAHS